MHVHYLKHEEKWNKEENKLFIIVSSNITAVNILENSTFLVCLYIVIMKSRSYSFYSPSISNFVSIFLLIEMCYI